MDQWAGDLLVVAQMIRLRWFLRSIDPAARFLILVYLLLGILTELWIRHPWEPPWFTSILYWRPTFLYLVLALSLVIPPWLGWGYPVKYILGPHLHLAEKEWLWLCRIFALAYLLLGGVNLAFAYDATLGDWVGFKEACMMNLLFLILLRINLVWLGIVSNVLKLILQAYRRIRSRAGGGSQTGAGGSSAIS